MRAVYEDRLKVVRTLLASHKVDINATDDRGATALHHAVAQNFTEIARVLIAGGIDIGTADQEGRTALMIASARGNSDLVMLIRQFLKKQSD